MSELSPSDSDTIALDTFDVVPSHSGMIGDTHAIRDLLEKIQKLANYPTTVLVHGETGSGKELVARALHNSRPAPRGPLVIFNCSNLLGTLAESQLFGHVRGAFTDAREDSLGLFRAADEGTLFLDEIGELPIGVQAKLLRALETHEVQPVGSNRWYRVNFRLVVATNRDLRAMAARNAFRSDLFYRLSVVSLTIPSLRERATDIPALVAHFVRRHASELGSQPRAITRNALEALVAYRWPGNVRELCNAVASMMLNCEGDVIDLQHLPAEVLNVNEAVIEHRPLDEYIDETDPAHVSTIGKTVHDAVVRCLEHTHGNRSRAAEMLGISRSTLYRILARNGERVIEDLLPSS